MYRVRGPELAANSSRAGTTSTAMMRVAPTIFAAITALKPTAPVPNTAIDCPGRT
jgi:hypothetical protein